MNSIAEWIKPTNWERMSYSDRKEISLNIKNNTLGFINIPIISTMLYLLGLQELYQYVFVLLVGVLLGYVFIHKGWVTLSAVVPIFSFAVVIVCAFLKMPSGSFEFAFFLLGVGAYSQMNNRVVGSSILVVCFALFVILTLLKNYYTGGIELDPETKTYLFLYHTATLCLMTYLVFKNYRDENDKMLMAIHEQNEQLVALEKEKFELQLEQKHKEFDLVHSNHLAKLSAKKKILNDLKAIIDLPNPVSALEAFHYDLGQQTNIEDKVQSKQDDTATTNSQFQALLLQEFPILTKTEREVCTYLKMDLSIKEIAAIKQCSVNNVSVVRSRIRKKLELPKAVNLEGFIQGL